MFDIGKVDRGVELFIFDIYIAILKIKEVTHAFDNVQNLLHDFRSWDSVIREFEIIGEATKYLLRDNLLSKDYQIIVDFRNQITHEYFGIDQDAVWTISNHDLSDFEEVVLELINGIEPMLKQELIKSFIEDNHCFNFIVTKLKGL
jgi:uncharacterized protein with HEPN domain